MQKDIVDKLIDKICSDSEALYECNPRGSAKVIPNLILLLEVVSLGSDYEEKVNRILQNFYFAECLKEARRELNNKVYRMLFKNKTYEEKEKICDQILMDTGFYKKPIWSFELRSFIEGNQGTQNSKRFTDEFKTAFYKYVGIDPGEYYPSKGEYKEYLIRRQTELMKLLEDDNSKTPEIEPDLKYQGMTRDMKEALFNRFSQFIEKTFNDAWEGKIDQNKLCSETQELTTDLKEYKRVVNS